MEIRLLAAIRADVDMQDRCNVDHRALRGVSMTRKTKRHTGMGAPIHVRGWNHAAGYLPGKAEANLRKSR